MAHSTPIILASVFSSAVALMFLACSSSDPPAASPVEAGADAAPDAASDGAVVCGPQLVPGFTVKFHPAAGLYQGKCTSSEIDSLIEICVKGGGLYEPCMAAKAAAPSCAACFFSPADATPSAPILLFPTFYERNRPACVGLLTGDSSATSCAAKTAASFQCQYESCKASCPLNTDADFVPFNACGGSASKSDAYCKPAVDAADACLNMLPVDVIKVCFEDISNGALLTVFKHYGELFCGSSPDAGADAGDGG